MFIAALFKTAKHQNQQNAHQWKLINCGIVVQQTLYSNDNY